MKAVHRAGLVVLSLVSLALPPFVAQEEVSLEEANRQFANPLSSATLWITENNYVKFRGDITGESRDVNLLIVDPLIPLPLFDTGWSVVHRPILPIISGDVPLGVTFDQPPGGGGAGISSGGGGGIASPMGDFDNRTGIGDFTYFAAFTPPAKSRFIWGAGPIVRLPTATENPFGADKVSAGLMGVGLLSGKSTTIGALNQNLFSVAGEGDAESVGTSTLQYFIFHNFTPKWGFGTAPTIVWNWNADRSDDQLAFPIGAGVTRSFRIGSTPSRLLLEYQYFVIDQDTYGADWNLRVAWALFLPSFGGK